MIPIKQISGLSPATLVAGRDVFGWGKDGALVSNSGTYTLTQDTDFSDVTLTGTARIDVAGYEMRVSGTLDVRGMPAFTIFRTAQAGGAGAATTTGGTAGLGTVANGTSVTAPGVDGTVGGAGGIAGGTQAALPTTRAFGSGNGSGPGGKGGTGTAGAGGASRSGSLVTRGARSLFSGSFYTPTEAGTLAATGSEAERFPGAGGTGGSGGGGDGTAGGGGGGGASGCGGMRIFIRNLLCAGAAAACIGTKGGNGGAGGSPAAGNRGGGGGGCGGGGGYTEWVVGTLLDAGAVDLFACDGGDGGNGGNGSGTGTGGDGGGNGSGGRLVGRFLEDGAGGVPYVAEGFLSTAGAAAVGAVGGAGPAGEQVRVGISPSGVGWVAINTVLNLLWDSYRRYPQQSQTSPTIGATPYTARETGSRLLITTDATSIDIEAMQDELVFTGPTGVGLLVNGVAQGNGIQLPSIGVIVRANFALPAGVNQLQLLDGPALMTGTPPAIGQQPRHTPLLRYRLNGATLTTLQAPTVPVNLVVVCADSTGAGFFPSSGNQSPAYQGCYQLMRQNIAVSGSGLYAGARVVIDATGGLRLQDICSTAQLRTDFIAKLTTQLAGTGNKLLILGPISVNDFTGGFAAAATGTALDALCVAINVAFPALKILLVTALTTVNEAVPNGAGSTLPNFRTQMNNVAAAHPGFMLTPVSGPAIVTFPGNFNADQLHPNTPGMVQEEAGIRPSVGY